MSKIFLLDLTLFIGVLSELILIYLLYRSDLNKLRIDMGMILPRIEITGKYEVSGQVLLFPVRSQGNFWAAFGKFSSNQKSIKIRGNFVFFLSRKCNSITIKSNVGSCNYDVIFTLLFFINSNKLCLNLIKN